MSVQQNEHLRSVSQTSLAEELRHFTAVLAAPSLAFDAVGVLALPHLREGFQEFTAGQIWTVNLIGQPKFSSCDEFSIGILSILRLFGWCSVSWMRLAFAVTASVSTRNTCYYR